MAAFEDKTGQVYQGLRVLGDAPGRKFNCICIKCGAIDEYWKRSVIVNGMGCKTCKTPGNRVDRTGQVFGTLKVIIDKPGNKFKCKCNECGHTDIYLKSSVKKGKQCTNCGVHGHLKSKLGKVYGNLKVVIDNGGKVVTCQCLKCGHKDIYDKHNMGKHRVSCTKCVAARNIADRTGETFRNLTIIEELGKNAVTCKCNKCGAVGDYNKRDLVSEAAPCRSCGVSRTVIDRVGEVYSGLKIVEELGRGRVICICERCGNKGNYSKNRLMVRGAMCQTCNLQEGYRNKVVNNIRVIDFEYTGRDKLKYFTTICLTCGEVLTLNEEEIPKYECE